MTNMNILFLADPNSIHDIKWITYFSKKYNCYLVSRDAPHHKPNGNLAGSRIIYIGSIKDYSTIKFWKNYYEAQKLKIIIDKYQIKLFHILYTEPNVLWANFKQYFNIPIIATNRGSDILISISNTFKSRSLLNYFVAANYKKAFANCDRITCTSNSQIKQLKVLDLAQHPILIRTGIDMKAIDSLCHAEIAKTIKKPFVLFPRNMRPVYNHELALEAIKLLHISIRSKFDWVFIDADSNEVEYIKKIKSIIATISDVQIHFLNRLTHAELFPLIRNASLIVMTNLSDGSPVSAMEAMYLKTPLLISPLKYDEDIFGNVSTFREFSPRSIADAITAILSNNKTSNTEKINMQTIIEKGNKEIEMNKLEMHYNQLTNEN
jgi:glycosyl transferase family 4/glycosyl transferase family 1